MRQGELARLRLVAERALTGALWLHGPALLVAALLTGRGLGPGLGLWLLIAVAASVSHAAMPGSAATRVTVAVGLCLQPALLLLILQGQPWQPDEHMHFFAELAVCAAMLDVQAVLAGATVVAAHHLLLNFVLPALVFPGGEQFFRVVFHAVIVIFETGPLAWLAHRAARAIDLAEAATADVAREAEARLRQDQATAEQMAEERRRSLREMANLVEQNTNEAMDKNTRRIVQMEESVTAMFGLTSRVETDARRVAASAAQMLAGADAVAGQSSTLTQGIEDIARQAANATDMAARAANAGAAARERITSLAEASRQIDNVLQLIVRIASQTNLLALNATIEAARAGEAGRGFAVVASEVKNLANQTAQSSGEISRLVSAIRGATGFAVDSVGEMGSVLEEISQISRAVGAAVERQADATLGIAREVGHSASVLKGVTADMASLADQAAAATQTASTLASTWVAMSGDIEELGHQVLTTIRKSAPDTDRRAAPRRMVNQTCRCHLGGVTYEVRLRDVSAQGARIEGVLAGAAITGGTGELEFEGKQTAFRVQNIYADGGIGVVFAEEGRLAA